MQVRSNIARIVKLCVLCFFTSYCHAWQRVVTNNCRNIELKTKLRFYLWLWRQVVVKKGCPNTFSNPSFTICQKPTHTVSSGDKSRGSLQQSCFFIFLQLLSMVLIYPYFLCQRLWGWIVAKRSCSNCGRLATHGPGIAGYFHGHHDLISGWWSRWPLLWHSNSICYFMFKSFAQGYDKLLC